MLGQVVDVGQAYLKITVPTLDVIDADNVVAPAGGGHVSIKRGFFNGLPEFLHRLHAVNRDITKYDIGKRGKQFLDHVMCLANTPLAVDQDGVLRIGTSQVGANGRIDRHEIKSIWLAGNAKGITFREEIN